MGFVDKNKIVLTPKEIIENVLNQYDLVEVTKHGLINQVANEIVKDLENSNNLNK